MPQPDDGRGNLYEQVLEYAKREMDEAASKMEDIKQSLQLLEARVEAAKAVYQAVASRLNLEDEADGATFDTSYPDAPVPAPEPPPAAAASPAPSLKEVLESAQPEPKPEPEPAAAEEPAAAPSNGPAPTEAPSEPAPPAAESSDLSIIKQHLEAKAKRENESADAPAEPAEAPAPAPVPAASQPQPPAVDQPSGDDDSFSMQLIRQHLEQKAKEQDSAPADPAPAEEPAPVAEPEAAAEPEPAAAPATPPDAGGGLSEADRELIGAYLRSKQN